MGRLMSRGGSSATDMMMMDDDDDDDISKFKKSVSVELCYKFQKVSDIARSLFNLVK